MIHYLKNDPGPQIIQTESDEAPTNNFGVNNNYNTNTTPLDNLDDDATNTLALGYSFIDVQDEENEGNYMFIKKRTHINIHHDSGCEIRCISIGTIFCGIHAFT